MSTTATLPRLSDAAGRRRWIPEPLPCNGIGRGSGNGGRYPPRESHTGNVDGTRSGWDGVSDFYEDDPDSRERERIQEILQEPPDAITGQECDAAEVHTRARRRSAWIGHPPAPEQTTPPATTPVRSAQAMRSREEMP